MLGLQAKVSSDMNEAHKLESFHIFILHFIFIPHFY